MNLRRILALSAAPLLFADYQGIPPRASSADYPAHADSASVSIGASAANSAQIRRVFGWDWTSRYIFVEVGMYPEAGQLSVAPRDFMLRVGGNSETLSPVDAEAIVPGPKPMDRTPSAGSSSPVDVRVRETIGYSSGPGPNNRGVYTDTQVGVAADSRGIPAAAPPPSGRTDASFELYRALMNNELPDAKTSKPIAGYLYFRKPKGMKKSDTLELKYYGGTERLTLSVPPVK